LNLSSTLNGEEPEELDEQQMELELI